MEVCRSLRLEAALSKDEILRRYFDRAPLGNNLMGVEAGAWAYFGKTASQLNPGEAATLAALVKAPGALNPYGPRRDRLLARQRPVLSRMAQLGFLSPQELQARQSEPVRFRGNGPRPPAFPFEAPHFVNLVLARERPAAPGSQRLRTTLDLPLQRRAQAIVASHRVRLLKAGASQAAAVIVANGSREVLALVGSCAYGPRDQGFNNGATAWRSPGSTLKPFLYALALDQGFTPASVLEDVEQRYRTPRGEFIPANFDRVSHGPISFREALGNSLNLSAVHLLNLMGPEIYYGTLAGLQLINRPEFTPEHYGLGMVVGNPEVSLLQLAAAFACLANDGRFGPLRFTLDTPKAEGTPVFTPQAAFIISDILSDPMARVRIFGGASAMNPPYRMAIKTGTSTHYRDLWAVAYTPEYTLAVWAGNFDGRPTANLSGAGAAAPIVADLAEALFAGSVARGFQKTCRGRHRGGVRLLWIKTRLRAASTGARNCLCPALNPRRSVPITTPRNPGTACPSITPVGSTSAMKRAAKAGFAWPTLIRTWQKPSRGRWAPARGPDPHPSQGRALVLGRPMALPVAVTPPPGTAAWRWGSASATRCPGTGLCWRLTPK